MVSRRQVQNWKEGVLARGTELRETEVYLVRKDAFGIGSNQQSPGTVPMNSILEGGGAHPCSPMSWGR